MKFLLAITALLYFLSCKQKSVCEKITVNKALLDSVQRKSDTSFIKRYRNKEFTTAEYYINRSDTTVCQVMKDTAGRVRQIIIAKGDVKLFTAEYYGNGQLKAHLPFDETGRLNGKGEYYFENGCVKSNGVFHSGLYYGEWKNYNEMGKNISKDEYDLNGQLIKTIHVN